jgi:hypothetical protein
VIIVVKSTKKILPQVSIFIDKEFAYRDFNSRLLRLGLQDDEVQRRSFIKNKYAGPKDLALEYKKVDALVVDAFFGPYKVFRAEFERRWAAAYPKIESERNCLESLIEKNGLKILRAIEGLTEIDWETEKINVYMILGNGLSMTYQFTNNIGVSFFGGQIPATLVHELVHINTTPAVWPVLTSGCYINNTANELAHDLLTYMVIQKLNEQYDLVLEPSIKDVSKLFAYTSDKTLIDKLIEIGNGSKGFSQIFERVYGVYREIMDKALEETYSDTKISLLKRARYRIGSRFPLVEKTTGEILSYMHDLRKKWIPMEEDDIPF